MEKAKAASPKITSKKKDKVREKKNAHKKSFESSSDTFPLAYLIPRNIDHEDQWLAISGRNRCYANEFSPFENTTLFKLCAGDFPSRVGPTPIKQIKFLPEIPTKKSQALPSFLGVLTSLVRDPCIVSIGEIPRRGREKTREKKRMIGNGNRWETAVSLGFYSQLSADTAWTVHGDSHQEISTGVSKAH